MQKKEKWIITALGFFSLCLAVAGIIVSQRRVTENMVSVMSFNNWGLSFREEGKAPDIDADKEMLKESDVYYLGDEEEKKIYLTFDAGYRTCFWSLAYVDWDDKKQPTKEEAMDKLTKRIHPGAIVLLHTTSSTNGEIMSDIIKAWKDMGYSFGQLKDL